MGNPRPLSIRAAFSPHAHAQTVPYHDATQFDPALTLPNIPLYEKKKKAPSPPEKKAQVVHVWPRAPTRLQDQAGSAEMQGPIIHVACPEIRLSTTYEERTRFLVREGGEDSDTHTPQSAMNPLLMSKPTPGQCCVLVPLCLCLCVPGLELCCNWTGLDSIRRG